MTDQATESYRPLLLFGLVSKSVFNGGNKTDFFSALLPFFEPYLASKNGTILSLNDLASYAAKELQLPLPREVAEIFVHRMSAQNWLNREPITTGPETVWRVTYTSGDEVDSRFKTLEADLDELYASIVSFTKKRFPRRNIPNQQILEEDLLSFLLANFTSRAGGDNAPKKHDEHSWDYVFARFIRESLEKESRSVQLLERLTGVVLITEALAEVRAPNNQLGKSKSGVIAFIDAPLMMARLGLSGRAARDDAEFMFSSLASANISVECLPDACDEIRDNLQAVLSKPNRDRSGPTAEALRRGEIQEVECIAIARSTEHFIQTVAGSKVNKMRFHSNPVEEKYFPSILLDVLSARMPSDNLIARERDARSIGLVMRRRMGLQTRSIYDCKCLFITSNPAVVGAANSTLRERGYLDADKSIVGPAILSRTIAGLIFANAGTSQRSEISRRQLLGACARVVMLRPRVVDQVREQFQQLSKVEDEKVLNALLTQPRSADVLMDFVVGQDRTISPEDHDELLDAMKKSLIEADMKKAEDIKRESAERIKKLEEELSAQAAELGQTAEKQLLLEKKSEDLDSRLVAVANQLADKSLRKAKRFVYTVSFFVFTLLTILMGVGSLHNTTSLGYGLGWFATLFSAFGLVAWLLNLKAKWVDAWIVRDTTKRLENELQEAKLGDFANRFQVTWVNGVLEVTFH